MDKSVWLGGHDCWSIWIRILLKGGGNDVRRIDGTG